MKQDKDMIEFDLNETLYFESGQEINEMVSISLDPDIAVQPYDSYVQIRGLIILQGEYRKEPNPTDHSQNANNAKNYIESVYETDQDQASFSHRFPVEISVPSYRVDNLNNISVIVDSFDYELPDQNQLKLTASVHIKGIKSDIIDDKKEQEESLSHSEGVETMNESEKSKLEDGNQDEEIHANEADLEAKDVVEENQIEETDEMEKQEEVESAIQQEEMKVEEVFSDAVAEEEIKEVNEIDIQLNEGEKDEDDDEVRDVQFLTDLFGNEEEETHTKMRIYITQEEDTIESIAKRYEISTLQLIKDNNLTEEGLEEGQLLHIPKVQK
ncbi:stage VI sporulation protein D [Pseudogracilibacillus sp. SO30301A]|uniref:stage VI sporulation protein D n=1 Tax=Pseudogracilibacillus sp. SO30301A TaxID=3098291 RepID=UPI00300DF6DA